MPYLDLQTMDYPLYEVDVLLIDPTFNPALGSLRFVEYSVAQAPIIEPNQRITWLAPALVNDGYVQNFLIETDETNLEPPTEEELRAMGIDEILITQFKLSQNTSEE